MFGVELLAAAGFASYQPAPLTAPTPKPYGSACSVVLFRDRPFSGDAPFFAQYAPKCRGPWSRVVLRLQTRIRGTQYDRVGAIWIDRAEMMRFTTAEPTKRGIAYSVEKDVTALAPLFTAPGPVTVSLANYVSKRYDGIYRLTAQLRFYSLEPGARRPHIPDLVVPVENDSAAIPWAAAGGVRAALPVLPRNIAGAHLQLYATNHACDEFWYTNVPDAYAAAHKSDGLCGGGTYREIDVAIDGRPAYVVYPFPYVWTGGINPLLWRPLPSIDALNVPPYDVDLDPWAGVLADGRSHTMSISVTGNRGTWPIDGNLLIWRDSRAVRTGGAITHDDFAPARVFTAGHLDRKGGTLLQTAIANWQVSGYVDTPRGRIEHTVRTEMHFENRQVLDLPRGVQNASQETTISTTLEEKRGASIRKETFLTRYPILADTASPPMSPHSPDAFSIRAAVHQARQIKSRAGSCAFSVDAWALLTRKKNGANGVERGRTAERASCTGPRPFTVDASARNGALISPTAKRRSQWKSNRPTSER